MTRTLASRRSVLKGLAGLSILGAGGVVYRAWDNGVFDVGGGPAYQPWHDWREAALDGPLAIVQAGILASNAHNTQPWRFQLSEERLAVFADHDRHLGTFDPFRRELALSLGCAVENMVHASGRRDSRHGSNSRRIVSGWAARAVPSRRWPSSTSPVASLTKSELFHAIAHRHTHRGAYDASRSVSAALQDEMVALSGTQDAGDAPLFWP